MDAVQTLVEVTGCAPGTAVGWMEQLAEGEEVRIEVSGAEAAIAHLQEAGILAVTEADDFLKPGQGIGDGSVGFGQADDANDVNDANDANKEGHSENTGKTAKISGKTPGRTPGKTPGRTPGRTPAPIIATLLTRSSAAVVTGIAAGVLALYVLLGRNVVQTDVFADLPVGAEMLTGSYAAIYQNVKLELSVDEQGRFLLTYDTPEVTWTRIPCSEIVNSDGMTTLIFDIAAYNPDYSGYVKFQYQEAFHGSYSCNSWVQSQRDFSAWQAAGSVGTYEDRITDTDSFDLLLKRTDRAEIVPGAEGEKGKLEAPEEEKQETSEEETQAALEQEMPEQETPEQGAEEWLNGMGIVENGPWFYENENGDYVRIVRRNDGAGYQIELAIEGKTAALECFSEYADEEKMLFWQEMEGKLVLYGKIEWDNHYDDIRVTVLDTSYPQLASGAMFYMRRLDG
ncbi:MAG: hypothetical protein IJ468_14215 [Lachnospiraceae bacterium]|nr:hypothetical protein [Lachnospiraceae bacterium]